MPRKDAATCSTLAYILEEGSNLMMIPFDTLVLRRVIALVCAHKAIQDGDNDTERLFW